MRRAICSLALGLFLAGSAGAAPSSYSKRGDGTKVLYLLLQDLGYSVQRTFSLTKELESDALVITSGLTKREGRLALEWVRGGAGRVLILAPPLQQGGEHCGDVALGELTIDRVFRFSLKSSSSSVSEGPEASPARPLKMRSSACVVEAPRTARVLAAAKRGAIVFEHPVGGEGKLLVLSHADMLVNARLDKDDLSVLLRRWLSLTVKPGATVVFFEQRAGGALWKLLKRANMLPLFFHGLVFLALLYWMLSPRFGDADAFVPAKRRAFAEHARALGTLYQRAGSSSYALRRQYERFRARMRHYGDRGLASAGAGGREERSRASLAALVSTRTGRDLESVESLLAQVEREAEGIGRKDAKAVQRDFRLSRALADLLQAARGRSKGRGVSG